MTRELTDAYQLLRRLGHGAMAEVHLAEDRATGRRVAVKRVLPHRAEDPEVRARFEAELALLSALCRPSPHPNVNRLLEVLVDAGAPAAALEHLAGPTLLELGPAMPPRVAVRVIGELLSALGFVHDLRDDAGRPLGVVHRDVTPSNVLFGEGARPVLIDFGVARTAHRAPLTATGAVVGKVGYLAPEIARGDDVDARADLFSVGAVLFELVCGRPAYAGDSVAEVLRRAAAGRHEDPRALRPALDDEQARFLTRAVAGEPAARFADAWEMSAAMHDAFDSATQEELLGFVEARCPGAARQDDERTQVMPEPLMTVSTPTKSIVDV